MKEIYERLAILETKVEDIISNHIPHLDTKVDKVVDKQDKLLWLLITNLIGVIILLLSKFMLK